MVLLGALVAFAARVYYHERLPYCATGVVAENVVWPGTVDRAPLSSELVGCSCAILAETDMGPAPVRDPCEPALGAECQPCPAGAVCVSGAATCSDPDMILEAGACQVNKNMLDRHRKAKDAIKNAVELEAGIRRHPRLDAAVGPCPADLSLG